jgi:hypothetical protein
MTAARLFRKEITDEGHELNPGGASAAAAIGTAVHSMMGDLFKQKLELGTMDIEYAMEHCAGSFEEELGKGVIWDKTTPHIDTAKAQLKALCKAFLPIAELTDPLDYETKREALVSPLGEYAIPIKISGTRDVRDKRFEIHDHKTGAKFPSCHAQLGCYALLAQLNDEEVSAVRVNYAPRLGITKLAEIECRSVRFDLQECISAAWTALAEIQRHHEKWLATKDPWAFPANPMSMRCTQTYCPAFGTSFCKVGKYE